MNLTMPQAKLPEELDEYLDQVNLPISVQKKGANGELKEYLNHYRHLQPTN